MGSESLGEMLQRAPCGGHSKKRSVKKQCTLATVGPLIVDSPVSVRNTRLCLEPLIGAISVMAARLD